MRLMPSGSSEADAMLIGTYEHTVDAKGRVFIPAKWREDLGDTIYVTRSLVKEGDYRCLIGMSAVEWLKIMENIRREPIEDARTRESIKRFLALANSGEVDKQGRLLLTNELRATGKLDRDVCLLGSGNRFEIWDAARWRARLAEDDDDGGIETLRYASRLGV